MIKEFQCQEKYELVESECVSRASAESFGQFQEIGEEELTVLERNSFETIPSESPTASRLTQSLHKGREELTVQYSINTCT